MKKASILRASTALVLIVMLMLSMATVAFSADDSARLYRGTFTHVFGEGTYYYSDAYFAASGKAQNEHLRTFSAIAAASADRHGEEKRVAAHILDLLTNVGFSDKDTVLQEMDIADRDTIGTVISKKMIGDTPLVAVMISGLDYEGEWASNMIAGEEGDALGFSTAADTVLGRIRDYLKANAISSAKLWITGYSRAGSVANLVGRRINENLAAYSTTADDLYVYTIEAPACSADDTVYENIHNVANENDFITYVYPALWGLRLNGVREEIGDRDQTIMAKSLDFFSPSYSKDYKEIDQSVFLTDFFDFIATYLPREKYVKSLQQPLADTLAIIFSKSPEEQRALLDYLKLVGESVQKDENLLSVLIGVIGDAQNPENIQQLNDFLQKHLDAVRAGTELPLTDEEYRTITGLICPLLEAVAPMVMPDALYTETDEEGEEISVNFYHFLTFAGNISTIVNGHIPDSVLKDIEAADSYYTEGAEIVPGDVVENGKRFTYDDLGKSLFTKARELGFTEDEIAYLKNGYDLSLDVEITPMEDMELLLLTMGKLDKSMLPHQLYTINVKKTVGFDSIPAEQTAAYDMAITLPDKIGASARYAVVRTEDLKEAVKIPCSVRTTANGATQLCFTAKGKAVYMLAYDGFHELMIGDVDRDLDLTVADVTHLQRHLAEMETFGEYQMRAADVDKDGDVTVIDVTHIQRRLAGMNSALDK